MGLLFSLRGDSLTPRYAAGGKQYSTFLGGPTLAVPPAPVALAHASCFGGWAIESNTTAGDYREWYYRAFGNAPRGTRNLSLRVRFAPNYSGTPPNDINIINIGQPRSSNVYGGARITLQDNNKIRFFSQPKNGFGSLLLSEVSLASHPLSSGVFKDYMLVLNDATGMWYASIEGVEVASGSLDGDGNGTWDLDSLVSPSIVFGTWPFRGWINEANIWDSAEPHVYSPRTAWLDCDDFDGSSYSDPGIANVRSGTNYTHNGTAKTGTATIPLAADVRLGTAVDAGTGTLDLPSASNVKSGVSYGNAEYTGTYTGAERYSDPGQTNVRAGVAYLHNNVNKNGSAEIPAASDVRNGTAVDNTTGTLTVPVAQDVRLGTSFAGTTGTMAVPTAAQTKIGIDVDGQVGTYDGSDRWTDLDEQYVSRGRNYKANSLTPNKTGTLDSVTNEVAEAILSGQVDSAILVETDD